MSSTDSDADSLQQISLFDALAADGSAPAIRSTLFAIAGSQSYYTDLVDRDLLKNDKVNWRLKKAYIFNSIDIFVDNEAGVTAVANQMLVDVAFRSLRAYIKTLEKPARVKLGDGVIMKAQSYIKQAGANRILDIRFVRIFEQKEADVKKPEENEPEKEHPKENESGKKKYTEGETILIVEMKAWGLLRVDSLDDDEICIKRGQALPTQTTFGGHAAKHVSQVGKYATDADCDTVVLMDLGHMEVFSFNEMERAKPGSGKKTKIGRGCIKTRFTNVNEHRRALTGVLLAAYQDLPRLDAYIPPTTPLSELDLNATSGPSAPDRVEIRRSDRIANSAGPSRTASPRPNPSGTSSRDASPLPPSLVHRSKQDGAPSGSGPAGRPPKSGGS